MAAILGDVAPSTLLGSIQSILLLFSEESRTQSVLNWLVGSLNGRGWREVAIAAPCILVALSLVGFVGLVVPHGVRLLVGKTTDWCCPI
ncbi:MAG: iron chelate uptake ABC transporter family permease subunit [Synechococcales cyanobacterium RU_4_20]|nr:iron chelate uptake ABC transporter family permease subunit [Synechococcales cyanobacterium RU_4_20]NJR67623.1 iron chelate uptake ABC transporter family permease subunit [Synechococcales cyanobacterium CRU_2_2]